MSYLPLVINGGGPTGEPLKSLQDPYPAPVIELKNEPVIPVEPYPAP